MNFARIRQLCEERGISITTLEQECGLKNGTVCKWKDDTKNPRVDSAKKVADYLNIAVDELLQGGDTT